MGIETALIAAGVSASTAASVSAGISTFATIASGVSTVLGGFQANAAAKEQSRAATQQGILNAQETERIAAREARFEQERIDETVRKQKIAYMKSGVTLAGSPLLIMEETRRKGQENVDEILISGQASADSQRQEGRLKAQRFRSAGRSSFIDGLTTGGGKILEAVA